MIQEHLADPLHWRRPRRIFVNSMSDMFHEKLRNEQIAAVFGVMAACPQHTFQILTKRAKRMREWFAWAKEFALDQREIAAAPNTARTMLNAAAEFLGLQNVALNAAWKRLEEDAWPLPNVWLGVSTENQETYVDRVRDLHFVPAAVHFISAEPLLGPIDMSADCINPAWIDWVIAGCESGPGARPCSSDWLRGLRDQCAAAAVPFFLKQAVEEGRDEEWECSITAQSGSKRKAGGVIELPYLDGVQHAAFPDGAKP
jgi:protein gp37